MPGATLALYVAVTAVADLVSSTRRQKHSRDFAVECRDFALKP
jgi:hypothetical protein